MNHNYLESLYQAVKNRAFQIECEVQLLHDQFFYIENLKGMEDRIKRLIFFKYSTLDAVHSIYEYYLENIQANLSGPCPFKKAMQYHFSTICSLFNPDLIKSSQQDQLNKNKYYDKTLNHLITIEANQEAIADLMGYNLNNGDETIEKLLESLYFLFPYINIIKLISSDNKFFTSLIKIAYDYDGSQDKKVKSHIDCLKQVYQLFPSNWCNYGKQTILAISEVLLGIFTFQQDNQNIQSNLVCFEISERCKYLVQRNLEQLSIKPDFITIIEKNLAYKTPVEPNDDDVVKKAQIKESFSRVMPLEYVDDSFSPIMCIHHVVLELRKLPLQPSVSLMCLVLMRTMNFLNTALCTEKKFVGADESFQFFVAGLADARLYRLPKILDQMKTFIVSDLTVGKISFLISQLECAINFIQLRSLPVSQYILFPFRRDDIKFLHLVTRNELNNDNQFTNNQDNSSSENPIEKTNTDSNNEIKNVDNTDTSNKHDSKISNFYSYVNTNINLESNEELVLTGFKICAFPTFLRDKGQIPAILLYTGDIRDKAIVYRYILNQIDNIVQLLQENLGPDFQTFGCIHGNIFYMNKKSDYKGLIYIDQLQSTSEEMRQERIEDYNIKVNEIAEFSNLMLMTPEPSLSYSTSPLTSKFFSSLPSMNGSSEIQFGGYVAFPEMLILSNLPRLRENFYLIWGKTIKVDNDKSTSDDHSTSSAKYYHQTMSKYSINGNDSFAKVKEIQFLLKENQKLDKDYDVKGIIDKETVYALKSCGSVALNKLFVLNFAAYNDIKNILTQRLKNLAKS